jgi:hypothetical protein
MIYGEIWEAKHVKSCLVSILNGLIPPAEDDEPPAKPPLGRLAIPLDVVDGQPKLMAAVMSDLELYQVFHRGGVTASGSYRAEALGIQYLWGYSPKFLTVNPLLNELGVYWYNYELDWIEHDGEPYYTFVLEHEEEVPLEEGLYG